MVTRRSLVDLLREAVAPLYDAREAEQIARLAAFDRGGFTLTDWIADPDAEAIGEAGAEALARELATGRPLQYVLGHTEFCGLDLAVGEGVLIPRPETEELVLRVAAESAADARILDVGTGSGCIALALKSLLPQASVTGIDLAPAALAAARANALRTGLDADFVRADALGRPEELFDAASFDTVVSNPPYVPLADLGSMHRNVVGFEPHEALFVPDDDPLRFYRAIARSARTLLRPGGRLWFEIYEGLGRETCDLLRAEGFGAVELHRDINEKPRMTCCTKSL